MIDTHQHLFYPSHFTYSWTRNVPDLQGTFDLAAYHRAAADCGIEGTLFMEVDVDGDQAADEARFFCTLTEDARNGLLGVVASGRPESDGFEAHLDAIAHPALKGIRRVLHTQPDDLCRSSLFHRNVAALAGRGLTFDLCPLPRQHRNALELVDACPDVRFVLDHCGLPPIAEDKRHEWSTTVREFARRPNVVCKVSGLPAYCPAGAVATSTLRPWFETVLEAFGWDRLLWGGDWPVCTLNSSLAEWCALTRDLVAEEDPANQRKFFTTNAREIYAL